MKKLLSVVLSLALIGGLSAPAGAVETPSADARLAAVTAAVKERLGLDTSGYASFRGNLMEGTLTPVWSLQWSGGDGELSLSCTEDGRILSYYAHPGETASSPGGFSPAFPALSREEARETALAFLEKALTKGVETAVLDEDGGPGRLSAREHEFSGEIQMNGLPSPFRFTVCVGVADNAVHSFHTMGGADTQYLDGVPSPAPAAERGAAGAALKETLALRLEYVREGDKAVLRYLPENTHRYYVDAVSGALVDLTALYENVRMGGLQNDSAGGDAGAVPSGAAEAKDRLTEAERSGVERLEGVLAKEALDAAARRHGALGLGKYTLASAAYSVDEETGAVSARLQYARQDGEEIVRRSVTLDGGTGALLAVSSSGGWTDEAGPVGPDAARKTAEGFLKEVCGGDFARTALYESNAAETGNVHSFTYAQKENGCFFPENSLNVDVDSTDGSVSRYSRRFEDVAFESAEGVVDMDTALDAWFGTYDVTLEYLGVPRKLDPSAPEYRPLVDMGQEYLYALTLSYALEREGRYLGVDAKTGAALREPDGGGGRIAYADLSGSWAETALSALADYGVGWLGGQALPGKALTQRDLVALLVSARRPAVDPETLDSEAADRLYEQAYSLGILARGGRDDGRVLSRIETVKLLLDSVGFGEAAGLAGIYRCAFTDAGDIPAGLYGYAALAQGLGVVRGDKRGGLNPNRAATRGEAAVMLYNFMAR